MQTVTLSEFCRIVNKASRREISKESKGKLSIGNPKAVSKLMGHAKEIITMNVYGDNRNIIADGVPEIEAYLPPIP